MRSYDLHSIYESNLTHNHNTDNIVGSVGSSNKIVKSCKSSFFVWIFCCTTCSYCL